MMKKYIKMACLMLLTALFSGACVQLEEHPLSQVTPEIAYKSYDDLYLATIGMFAKLRGDDQWKGGFNISQYMTPMFGSDDITCNASQGKPFMYFDEFLPKSSNNRDDYLVLWRSCYRTIVNANAIIENYTQTEGNREKIDNLAGQAYFCRALCYFYLVRLWGDIPLYTSSNVDPLLSKSPVSVVYDQIIDDLKTAEQLLPLTQSSIGMAKRGAAMAFLSKVYLTEAGWPLHDFGGYALAAEKSKELIDDSTKYGFGLMGDFASLWKRKYDNNRESVFAIQGDQQDGYGGQADGIHIIGASSMPGELGGWDDFFPEITFYRDFPSGPRKAATFLTYFIQNGDTVHWQHFITRHPYYAKFTDHNGPSGMNWQNAAAYSLMRFSEVLLIYAEAHAQASSPDEPAYNAINKVRNRAGLPDLPTGLNTAAFVDSVIAERGWELAGEGQRWFDLVRTEKIASVVAKRDATEQVQILGDFTDKKNWYAPILQSEILQDPNLAK
jgi:starch-binding outer membrane protein, SusD/RagB family